MSEHLTLNIDADELEMFLDDANELLQDMENGILHMEQADVDRGRSVSAAFEADAETLNATFRAAHTLKAMAGAVGHREMADLTHTLETLFDRMREGTLSPSSAVVDELLATMDVLKAQRDEVASRQRSGTDVDAVLARLRALMESGDGHEGASVASTSVRRLTPEQAAEADARRAEGHSILEIEVIANPGGFAPAARLAQASIGLMEAGHILAQEPTLEDLTDHPDGNRLWLVLTTESEIDVVEEILRDISELDKCHVQPYEPGTPENAYLDRAQKAPDARTDAADVDRGHSRRRTQTVGQTVGGRRSVSASSDGLGVDKTVRISVERLDTLMNLVGELVTDRTRLMQIDSTLRTQYGKEGSTDIASDHLRSAASVDALGQTASHFGRVVDQLQEEVMHARMLPISHLFSKLPRLVRDVSRTAGKQVTLHIEGEATEVDRSIIEVIGDPLMHLLRNAVDHGIEPPETRLAAGKPPTGTVRLSAAHEKGHIVITVEDDGQGINPDGVRQAAVDRGLFSEEELSRMDDDQAVDLIFTPTLSTAKQVTEVSGRGVGLDVVRTNVEKLNGSVTVEHEVGKGTRFKLTLPLTLAIMQAMLVGLGKDVYAIPLTGIVDSLYLDETIMHTVRGNPTIRWRDSVLPLLHLREFMRLDVAGRTDGRTANPCNARSHSGPSNSTPPAVVTVGWGKLRLGLVVDRIIGKQEIVVKSFSPIVGRVPALSGCTILGDGRIALIMDVSSLINTAMQAHRL